MILDIKKHRVEIHKNFCYNIYMKSKEKEKILKKKFQKFLDFSKIL